jgi:uncharacterized membrane protein
MVAFAVALAVGIIAGLRAMTGAAAAAWAAYLGVLPVTGTWLAWLASPWAVGIVTVFALVELVTDQLPSTPSRKVPVQFGTRVLIGAVTGGSLRSRRWIGPRRARPRHGRGRVWDSRWSGGPGAPRSEF